VAALIAAQRDEHQIPHAVSCRALGVSRAWFYKWRGGALGPRAQRRRRLAAEVARLFAVHEGKYGSPRITADLRDAGWRVSENTVAALMREAGLAARRKKRRKATTRPGRGRWRAPDLVRRKFPAARINTKWYGDGTEIATGQGKLHLSVTWNQDPRVGTGERFGQGSVSASQRGRGACGGWLGRGRIGGRFLSGTSGLLSGCRSGLIWDGHRGRSTLTRGAWPSICRRANATGSIR
jgi:hypothetical protein